MLKEVKKSLNPFEVREVLQERSFHHPRGLFSLNPFEVREVLQVIDIVRCNLKHVSIPLKSGRCCKSPLQNLFIKINKLYVSFC